MDVVQRNSANRRIEILLNEVSKAIPTLSEDEANVLLHHMNDLAGELARRTRHPTPFRETWKPVAEALGLTTRSLSEYPPTPQLAQLCRQEVLVETLRTGGAYPIVGPYDGRPAFIVCYPFYARRDGVDMIEDEVLRRHGTGLHPFGSMIYGEFEESEIRDALSRNLSFFATV